MRKINLFDHVQKTETCWLWTGKKHRQGYGWCGMKLAHRVSWEIHFGPIPKGECVLHKCDVPACVNPKHLFLGTQLDNIEDMRQKRRTTFGEKSARAKLTESQVVAARSIYADRSRSMRSMAIELDVSFPVLRNAIIGRTWKHLP